MLSVTRCRQIFVFLTALAALLVLWQSLSLPAPQFEPVGGARVPQATAALILLLTVIAVIRPESIAERLSAETVDRRGFVLTLLFVIAIVVLSMRLAGFATVMTVFLVATQVLYRDGDRRWIWRALALALTAVALEYLFTQVFVIDLQRTF